MGRRAGAGASASSPEWRRASREPIPASSSPTCPAARPGRSTRTSTAGAGRPRTTSWKTHLRADRTSCTRATANQFRLFLHAGAYWLMWRLRTAMPKRSNWRVAQFDTLRLRLIKIAARIVELKTQLRIHLPSACPVQDILRLVLGRIPRLLT